jgi:hypothetical protein
MAESPILHIYSDRPLCKPSIEGNFLLGMDDLWGEGAIGFGCEGRSAFGRGAIGVWERGDRLLGKGRSAFGRGDRFLGEGRSATI